MSRLDLMKEFLLDANELLDNIESVIVHMERGLTREELDGLLRVFHTLKGNASIVGMNGVRDVSHAVEGMIGDVLNKGAIIKKRTVDLMLLSVDAIKKMLQKAGDPAEEMSGAPALLEKIREFRQEFRTPLLEDKPANHTTLQSMGVKTIENLAILELPQSFGPEHSGDLIALLKDLASRGISRFIFDFRNNESISDGGVEIFVTAKNEIEQNGGIMAACRLDPKVHQNFSGAGGLMNIKESLREALNSVEGSR